MPVIWKKSTPARLGSNEAKVLGLTVGQEFVS